MPHVVIECFADRIGTCVIYGFTTQHPLVFGDIIVTNSASLLVNALKQPTVNGGKLGWSERESFLCQYLRDTGRYFVSLLRPVVLHFFTSSSRLVVGVNEHLGFTNTDVAFNVSLGCVK